MTEETDECENDRWMERQMKEKQTGDGGIDICNHSRVEVGIGQNGMIEMDIPN